MSDSKSMVIYGSTSAFPSFQHVSLSGYPFEETVKRLKGAIESEDLWLIHEINPQMLLKRGGFEILPTRQLLFFHPRYMKWLLSIDPNALIEAPLKLVVMQMPDDTVSVRYSNVEMQFGRYHGLKELAEELATICNRLIRSISAEVKL